MSNHLWKEKNEIVFAHCSLCETDVALRSVKKATYGVRQHLATQVHKTNPVIAHLRESNVSVELSELHAHINPKFSNVSILNKSSDFCLASKIDISLLSRNIMGNLGQHVKGSSNLQNAWKGAISARDIAFFVPVTKISNLTDATK